MMYNLTSIKGADKKLYLGIIPIGNFDYKKFINTFTKDILITDNEYKKMRFIDSLKDFNVKSNNITNLPIFIPYEGLKIQNNISFRMIVSNPIYENNNANNSIVCNSPWIDKKLKYGKASWESCNKLIEGYCNCILILADELFSLSREEQDIVEKIFIKCKMENKECLYLRYDYTENEWDEDYTEEDLNKFNFGRILEMAK